MTATRVPFKPPTAWRGIVLQEERPVPKGRLRGVVAAVAPVADAAKINWKQVEGETITVAVIPASYFETVSYTHLTLPTN